MIRILLVCCCFITCGHIVAAEYLASPSGRSGGVGSREAPWPALEECVRSGKLGKLKPGDTLYLAEGYHGNVHISGVNDDWITITALPDADVRLSRLVIDPAAKWHIKNLRISPSFGQPYSGDIISFGERSGSGANIIEGCEVFAVDDHTGLDAKQWMALNSGILMGRHADGSIVRNCYVRNVRFGISVCAFDGIAEGNVSENYSADGMRLVRDRTIARHNVVKGAFVTEEQGDPNHDDSIQCFLHNQGTGTLRGLQVIENYLWGQWETDQPLASGNQGVAFFDGPLVDFRIEGNVVMVAHWHGIALFDAQNCTITRNWVWTEFPIKQQAWIMLGNKLKQARGNTVNGNWATSFKLGEPQTTAADNTTITKQIREQARLALAKKIVETYGLYHRTAKRHRFTGELVDDLPAERSSDDDTKQEKKRERVAIKRQGPAQPKDGEIERYNAKLQSTLDAYLTNNKRKPRFVYSLVNQEVVINRKDGLGYNMRVPKMGSDMSFNLFQRLKPEDALRICQAIADERNPDDNALLAFYLLATNDRANAARHLRLAGEQQETILAAFTEP